MIKRLLCTAVLLFSATALRADVFSFSYGGTSGTLTASDLGLGAYQVTALTATRNGTAISGGGAFLYGSPSLFSGSLSLGSKGNVAFVSSFYTETGFQFLPKIGNDFSLTRGVPEPTTMLLLFTMGLGVWVLARKLPSRNTRQS